MNGQAQGFLLALAMTLLMVGVTLIGSYVDTRSDNAREKRVDDRWKQEALKQGAADFDERGNWRWRPGLKEEAKP